MKIQVRKPFFPDSSILKIQKNINESLKIGRLSLGKNVSEMEKRFAKYLKIKYVVAVSSATAGLHISLLSSNIKQGDEVIVPPKTFISTANAAIYCNAKPIFCDVDEDSFNLDPKKLQKLITKKTRAIIPVHIGGNICHMDEILEIATRNNLTVIEDAAHAHGATLQKKKAGTFGDLGVFSFYPDKVMASSDGGIIVTNNKSHYDQIQLLRNIGRKKMGEYDFTEIGYNYRMNEIQAIIVLEQLRILPEMLKKRRKIASIYDEELKDLKDLKIQKIEKNVQSSYYAYILRLTNGNLKNLVKKLSRKGIETTPMFTSLYKTKIYKKILEKKYEKCPISELLDDQTFTIPLHPGLIEKEIHYVTKEIKNIINKN